MTYKIKDKITYTELQSFFKELDSVKEDRFWARDIFHYKQRTKKKELQAIKQSQYFTVRDMGKLIGFIRVITDNYFYFIIEVAVLPDYQGKGIGKRLMNFTLDYIRSQEFIKIFLFAIPNKETYYAKFGFKNTKSQAMEIRPDEKNN
jgi:ribosomal protein S18 acetylase RimI-like enzyme